MLKKVFQVLHVLFTIVVCLVFIYTLISGFVVGSYAMEGEDGLKYIIMYLLLSIGFPVAVCIMYHYINHLQKKIEKLENEIYRLKSIQSTNPK